MKNGIYKGVRFIARLAVFGIALLTFCSVVIIALTQVNTFRAWAIDQGLAYLNDELAAELTIGDIQGNLITGLTIKNATLTTDGEQFISAPEIDLRYTLFPIITDQAVQADVILHNPVVNLIRNTDSLWNFQNITKPSATPPDTTPSSFAWKINLGGLELKNATVTVDDRTSQPLEGGEIDLLHCRLLRVNLALSAHIDSTRQNIWMQHLSFELPEKNFTLVELAGRFKLDNNGLDVADMRLETGGTLLDMDAHLDSVGIFTRGFDAWRTAPFRVTLDADRIAATELMQFIPPLDFLGGSPAVVLDVEGTMAEMTLKNLDIELDQSELHIAGSIRDMLKGDAMFIDVAITDSKLNYADVPRYTPGLPIPDLGYLGTANLYTASYTGNPRNFISLVDITTDIGAVRGGMAMDIRKEIPAYSTDLALVHVDFERLADNPEFKSDFSGRLVARGTGFSLETIAAEVRLKSVSSSIAGRSYRALYFDGAIGNGGYFSADTLLIAWGSPADPAPLGLPTLAKLPALLQKDFATLEQQVTRGDDDNAIFAANPSLSANGWFDMRDPAMPAYRLGITGDRVDIAAITLNTETKSSLTFTMEASGKGLDLDSIQGSAILQATDVQIPPGRPILPFTAQIELERKDMHNRSITLRSDIADAEITGKWRFQTLLPILQDGIDELVNYITRKQSYQQDDFFFIEDTFTEPIDATYDLQLKDLTILKAFMQDSELNIKGSLEGLISGTSRLLSITTKGTVQQFRFTAPEQVVTFADANLDIDIRNISPGHIDDLLNAQISIGSDSLIQYNDLGIRLPELKMEMTEGLLYLHGSTAIDGQVSVALDGTFDVADPEGYKLHLDTLLVALPRGLEWRNVSPIYVVLGEDEVRIDSMVVQRKNAETVGITGGLQLSTQQFRNVEITLYEGSLKEIRPFIEETAAYSTIETLGGNLRQSRIRLGGTLEKPEILANIMVDSLYYSNQLIGDLAVDMRYRNENLMGSVIVRDLYLKRDDTASVAASIAIAKLPIDLAFTTRDERLIEGKPLKITATTKNLPIAFVEPFTTGALVKGGTATLDFTVEGNYPELNYSGAGSISNARVLVEANNIMYIGNAEAEFRDEVLNITKVDVRNIPSDYAQGKASAQGRITFDGLQPSYIDITGTTDGLLVLSEATQAVNEVIYGDLTVATGDNPIHFYGTLDHPRLEGDVRIINGNLTFPESGPTVSRNSQVVIYEDAQELAQRQEQQYGPVFANSPADSAGRSAASDTATGGKGSLLDQSKQMKETLDTTARKTGSELSIAEKMDIDLKILVTGRLFTEIDLGFLQQLALEIGSRGEPLIFRRIDGVTTLDGVLELETGSRVIFYKSMEASGELRFRNTITNPELNITATRNGRRVSQGQNTEDYTVTIIITGTKEQPDIRFDYSIQGKSAEGDRKGTEQNAISLLLTGRTFDEIGSSGLGGSSSEILSENLSAVTSTALGQVFSGAFSNTGVINSVDVELGQDFSQARVNLVSQFGDVLIRYGGDVSSPSDGTITIDLPLSVATDPEKLQSIVLQLQREVRNQYNVATNSSATPSTQNEIFRAKVQLRTSW